MTISKSLLLCAVLSAAGPAAAAGPRTAEGRPVLSQLLARSGESDIPAVPVFPSAPVRPMPACLKEVTAVAQMNLDQAARSVGFPSSFISGEPVFLGRRGVPITTADGRMLGTENLFDFWVKGIIYPGEWEVMVSVDSGCGVRKVAINPIGS